MCQWKKVMEKNYQLTSGYTHRFYIKNHQQTKTFHVKHPVQLPTCWLQSSQSWFFLISHCCFKNQRQGRDQYFCTVFGLFLSSSATEWIADVELEKYSKGNISRWHCVTVQRKPHVSLPKMFYGHHFLLKIEILAISLKEHN